MFIFSSFGSHRAAGYPTSAFLWTPARRVGALLLVLAGFTPGLTWACACGCGVFDVGTGSMFPDGPGLMMFFETDIMDQNKNWSGTSRAPPGNNDDKRIRTDFYTLGAEYLFNRSWGVMVELPYWRRYFQTTDEGTGNIVSFDHSNFGDLRIRGIYSGFSPDLSTGLTFGLKLPTGDSTYPNFDPDTEIGTGSTDLLLGGYHLGKITSDGRWSYFVRAQWDKPFASKAVYNPGGELVAAAGGYYAGWSLGRSVKVAPVLQVTGLYRGRDGGSMGHPEDSGYTRLVITPGIEIDVSRVRVYMDAGFAVYNNMNGNQLVAKQFYKVSVSYGF